MSNSTTPIDTRDLRRALGAFATGVTVVTTRDDDGRNWGFTANSFTSVSLDPPLVLACIARSAYSCDVYCNASAFAVNILAETQRDISATFAKHVEDRFHGVSWNVKTTGSPVIDNVVSWFDCEMHDTVDAGDHVILIGKIVEYGYKEDAPLGYCRGAYVSFNIAEEILRSTVASRNVLIGTIVERDGALLLRKVSDDSGNAVWSLPTANAIGSLQDTDSLLGKLNALGLQCRLPFVFAFYDSEGVQNIYYREEIFGDAPLPDDTDHAFVSFDDIPWQKITDSPVRTMLKRYVDERQNDAFGIYIGNADAGEVHIPG